MTLETRFDFSFISRAVLGAIMGLAAGGAAAEDLSLSYFMGPGHRFNSAVFLPFAERLAAASGGAMTVTQYPAGALNSAPPMQYASLRDGISDIAFGLPSYTHELFPVTDAVSIPGICAGAIDCTEALWRAMPLIESEYDAHILALWSNGQMAIVSRNRPIRTLEDFAGLKIRVSSRTEARFLAALGAAPVAQEVTVINQNLANGTIDAIAIDPASVVDFRLYEPATHVTIGMPTAGLAFFLLMNRGVYEGLSESERVAVDLSSGLDLSIEGARVAAEFEETALDTIRANGVEIIEFTSEEQARIADAFAAERAAFLAETLRPGVTGADAWAAFQGE